MTSSIPPAIFAPVNKFEVTDRKPKRDEYRGNQLLVLPLGENREFSFGVGKARAILHFIDDIKKFVAEYEPEAVAERLNKE